MYFSNIVPEEIELGALDYWLNYTKDCGMMSNLLKTSTIGHSQEVYQHLRPAARAAIISSLKENIQEATNITLSLSACSSAQSTWLECQVVILCTWILREQAEHPMIVANILFTDEVQFTIDSVFNFYNWADKNPYAIRKPGIKNVSVWMFGQAARLIGSIILPNRLTNPMYLDFLRNTLPRYLKINHWIRGV